MGIFLEGEDSRGDHVLGRLVEFRFKAPPGTTSSPITTHTPSGQRNCASWASQSQKSVTLLPCPGGRTTKSTKDMWWHWKKKNKYFQWCWFMSVHYIIINVLLFPLVHNFNTLKTILYVFSVLKLCTSGNNKTLNIFKLLSRYILEVLRKAMKNCVWINDLMRQKCEP